MDRDRNIVHSIGWEEIQICIHIHITHFSAEKSVCVFVCVCVYLTCIQNAERQTRLVRLILGGLGSIIRFF